MSKFALELLNSSHDRKKFSCGLASIDQYLQQTARGHTNKGVSLTRVLVRNDAASPKLILGYFTLTPILIEAAGWPNIPKGLPKNPVGAILLGRLGVNTSAQGAGIAARMIAFARRIAFDSLTGTGGIGLVVDAASEELVHFYQHYGFVPVSPKSRRLFLPTYSLVVSKRNVAATTQSDDR